MTESVQTEIQNYITVINEQKELNEALQSDLAEANTKLQELTDQLSEKQKEVEALTE
jgi:hypothetical protein